VPPPATPPPRHSVDLVEPRRRCRGEVHVEAWMPLKSSLHLGVLVCGILSAIRCRSSPCGVLRSMAVYFGARDTVVCSKRRSWLVRASLRLFTRMFRNSVRAVDLFNLPPKKFVEVGRQLEI
jgi:hypothetical protein